MPPQSEYEGERNNRLRTALYIFLLLLLPALVFSNTPRNVYHLDSVYRVKNNTEITQFWPPSRFFVDRRTGSTIPQIAEYRPLMPLSLAMDAAISRQLGGDRLVGHLVGNIAIHAVTTLLIFALFWQLLTLPSGIHGRGMGSATTAFVGAMIFAIHPVSGVPINYAAARDLLLMLLFLVAALLIYVRMRRDGDTIMGWCSVLGLFCLSLLSKQNAIMAFAVIFLLEFFMFRTRLGDWRLWARTAAFLPGIGGILLLDWATAGTYGIFYTSAADDVPLGLAYPLTMAKAHLFYYGKNMVWPFEMRPLPRFDLVSDAFEPMVLLGVIFIVGSLVSVWYCRRRCPIVSFAIMSYWALFALTSSIFPFEFPVTDYRQYPSLPFGALLVAMAIGSLAWRPAIVTSAVLLTLYVGVSAYEMNKLWHSSEALWGQSVRYGARETAHMNYAQSIALKNPTLAEHHYKETLRIYPNHIYGHINFGLFHIRQGNREKGLSLVERAVQINPKWALSHYWLGRAYGQVGRRGKALTQFKRAADLDPRSVLYQYEAARALQVAGQVAASVRYLDRLQVLNRRFRDTLFLAGWAHQAAGRGVQAMAAYRAYLKIVPHHTKTHFNLGYALMTAGQCEKALPHFHAALARSNARKAAHLHLSNCYRQLGDAKRASHHKAQFERP